MGRTQRDVAHFRSQGYLRVGGELESSFVSQLHDALQGRVSQLGDSLPKSDGQYKLYRFAQWSGETGQRLIRHPLILSALEPLLGPNIVFQLNRHNQATINGPGDAEPRLHRDILQWSRHLITVLVYLDDSHERNGCTSIVPGSQFAPFVGVPQADGGGTWLDEHSEFDGLERQAVPVPMPRGGILLLDSLAFHSVGANSTDGSRASIALGYRSADELDRRELDETQWLVRGTDLYRGNDRSP